MRGCSGQGIRRQMLTSPVVVSAILDGRWLCPSEADKGAMTCTTLNVTTGTKEWHDDVVEEEE